MQNSHRTFLLGPINKSSPTTTMTEDNNTDVSDDDFEHFLSNLSFDDADSTFPTQPAQLYNNLFSERTFDYRN